ncbi:unnamed protein product, partial [Scytosiphon promiscuus]
KGKGKASSKGGSKASRKEEGGGARAGGQGEEQVVPTRSPPDRALLPKSDSADESIPLSPYDSPPSVAAPPPNPCSSRRDRGRPLHAGSLDPASPSASPSPSPPPSPTQLTLPDGDVMAAMGKACGYRLEPPPPLPPPLPPPPPALLAIQKPQPGAQQQENEQWQPRRERHFGLQLDPPQQHHQQWQPRLRVSVPDPTAAFPSAAAHPQQEPRGRTTAAAAAAAASGRTVKT